MGAGREVQISLDEVRDKNLMQLKKLNTVLFPVRYNDKYYADALSSGEFTKLGPILILVYGFFLFINFNFSFSYNVKQCHKSWVKFDSWYGFCLLYHFVLWVYLFLHIA